MAPIQQKLQNAIQAVGAKGGYTAILDSATLLYKGNSMEDVSAKVKAELGIKWFLHSHKINDKDTACLSPQR